ncbi:MAG TPA: PLP-dependent aminotransferase family protein [Nocardioidaceae bacterium]|nr:PLP-dependent aminotransferase family protein [Nocardioidaceae bacterium]
MLTATALPLRLDRRATTPLGVQIAAQVRGLLTDGVLAAGARLPSVRALAAELGVARAVVEQAYDQLHAEGWTATRRGAGTFVAAVGPRPDAGRRDSAPAGRGRDAAAGPGAAAVAPGRGDSAKAAGVPGARRVSLDTGTPWVDERLRAGWRRAWRDVAAARPPQGYLDAAGLPELRAELAGYVARTRGVVCSPAEVMVTSGTTHALRLLLATLGPGAVAAEDPGYRAAVATVRQSGRRVFDVPVDEDGADTAALDGAPDDLCAIYVTPAHQHPLGHTMSARRRLALLAQARRLEAVVVEDDYDAQFRYDVAPLPALASLDRDRVVHLGTVSKTLQASLRLGWLVGPEPLVARIAADRLAVHDHPSWPQQRALLSMLREGHLDKSVRAARRVYAERGELVAARLARHARLLGPVAGMYATLLLPERVAAAVVADCAAAGLDVPPLGDYARSSGRSGIVVGFGGIADDELAWALDVLSAALARRR